MSAVRELAFELTQLPSEQREGLLAELPPERRTVIVSLMAEIGVQLARSTNASRSFEQHLEAQAHAPAALLQLTETQMRLLLGAEHPTVQQHVAAGVRRSQLNDLGPAVASAIAEYLERRLEASESAGPEPRRPRRFWHKLLRMER